MSDKRSPTPQELSKQRAEEITARKVEARASADGIAPAPEGGCQFDHKSFLKQLTQRPGIYQMYDADGKILYVGKAKNLKNRVSSYFRSSGLNNKTMALVARIARVDVTVTHTEVEALILEQNLIKAQRPPFNILLRDDKSYPYVFLSSNEDYPRVAMHRGAKRKKGEYFGPFPNVMAVKESLSFLQKTFKVRQCEDSVFKNRSRPCLQYQIKRCDGPCVEAINKEDYAEEVRHTKMFLQGESDEILEELADRMEKASMNLEFEQAATYRDQISALRSLQSQRVVESGNANVDVIAIATERNACCIHLLYIRQGRILGSKSYYPKDNLAAGPEVMLNDFVGQYYLGNKGRDVPRDVILSHPLADAELLSDAIKEALGKTIALRHNVRSERQNWLQLAMSAAEQNLKSQLARKQNLQQRFELLQERLGLESIPQRIECFDISHSSGELTVASCVVFGPEGAIKSDYRRFNIEGITGGDDYAAMEQALNRRYSRIQAGEGVLPDILLIDGGKGQLSQAKAVLGELGVQDVTMIGVAKGTTRKAGFEVLHMADTGEEWVLDSTSPELHLIQQVRDEAHRFAVTGHKARRDKKRRSSSLEDIPGVGAKRRRELLRHFGGLAQIKGASADDMAKVEGISKKLAAEIYAHFHAE
ncbi:excinuclease ABC subunit UvrC [uncultured Pseudoteredinibacter sp.]|uniref:excinuclease ABC subunit UvrC n=1 Tax=uncultured Pseudoteredinibacter sp. TaxID=1641701 RepID=UPI00261838FA|nr:excinuclease ABC subunit UvrC [uncultured Pseudoteredinibacter sp.]